jgi:hypothetical protein
LLFLLGPAIYILLFRMHHLWTPWYAPILATVGVLLMVVSVRQRWGIVRAVGLFLLALICGLEWFMVLVGSSTPLYTGPAKVGRQLPAFTTTLASGQAFSEKDLENGTSTVLVFFRGRW